MMSGFVGDYNDCNDFNVDDLVVMLSSQELSAPNRSPQVTKLITVPTSEHVAQIVGKSGSKIKNLRTATQTCIKTPIRGDDPVFTVSGTEVNVNRVLSVIQQASDHFSRLMESRSNACAVGEVTALVEVPQQYVGVVVGRNGSVIMKIKEQTRTRINTPKGDSIVPSFEVTGSQVNVMAAKEAIEDKVRQALMLKDSTAYDPDLSHKTKSLTQPINWPPASSSSSWAKPPLPDSTTNYQIFNPGPSGSDNKPQNLLNPAFGWPTTSFNRTQTRTPSPLFFNSLNPFSVNPMSPSFMASNMSSFRF